MVKVVGYRKASKKWIYDPGAIPGEPEDYLLRDGQEVAVIIEDDILGSDRKHRVVLVGGEEVGRNLTLEEARELAEQATDSKL